MKNKTFPSSRILNPLFSITGTFALLFLVIGIMVSGCASTERNAFKAVGVVVTSVDTAMNVWGDYVKSGKATPEQIYKVRDVYVKYQASMRVARSAVSAYKADQNTKIFMETAVDVASASASDVISLVNLFMPPPRK